MGLAEAIPSEQANSGIARGAHDPPMRDLTSTTAILHLTLVILVPFVIAPFSLDFFRPCWYNLSQSWLTLALR